MEKGSSGGRPLKVGIQLPEIERSASWRDLLQMAQAAEAVGLDSIWVADHLLYRDERHQGDVAPWEAWSMLAALAAVTQRVEIGPLVACTAFHNPAMIAKKAETVDEISGGRLVLGLGAGWNRAEFDAYGFPFDHRYTRFTESFAIIRSLLRTGRADFAGDFYAARDCALVPRGPRPQGLPILIGTQGPQMLRECAAYADGWNAWYGWFDNDPERLPALLAEVDAACAAAGRDPASLERTAALRVQFPELPGTTKSPSDRPIFGSPEAVAAALRRCAELGVAHAQIVLDPNTTEAIGAMGPVLAVLDRDAG